MNTFQIRAFVSYLKKQKNIPYEKGKMVSNVIVGGDNNINSINRSNIKPKEFGDIRIGVTNR